MANVAPEWQGTDGWRVSDAPEVSIGGLGSPSGHLVWQVSGGGGSRLSDGRIVILTGKRDAPRLLIFDRNGDLVRSIGRPGRGPGEFPSAFHFQRLPGDTLVVWENFGRVTSFDTTGALLEIRYVDPGATREAVQYAHDSHINVTLPDGSFILYSLGRERPVSASEVPAGTFYRAPRAFTRVYRDYSAVLLGIFRGNPRLPVEDASGRVRFEHVPFSPSLSVATANDPFRLYVTEGTEAGIMVVDSLGTLLRMIRRSTAPRQVTSEDWEAYLDRLSSARYLDEDQRAATKRYYSQMEGVPTHHPPFANVRTDKLGYIWLFERRHDTNSATHSVFTGSGRWLGEVTLPFARILEIGGDYVLGVREDELQVESIHEYRLVREPR